MGGTQWTLLLPALALLAGCVEQPPPQAVPVYAAAEDMFVLEGDWSGQYWSPDTGRSGRIRLSLEAESDRAYGDVLMFAAKREENLGMTPQAHDRLVPLSETLTIEFVRVDAQTETITGVLDPYLDPDCSCTVQTTFTGTVSSDAIEGTFVTEGGGGYRTRRGNWRVERTQPEDPS
jgi:hypothetical protein